MQPILEESHLVGENPTLDDRIASEWLCEEY
jgi:hypothetical protein